MKAIFVLDVDTQRDLMAPSGSLYVPGAERLVPKLRRLFSFARQNEFTIISTVDAHSAGDPEFAELPPHCIRGTEGQKKLDETLLLHAALLESGPVDRNFNDLVRKHRQILIEKEAIDPFSNPSLEKLIRVLPPHAIVFGVPAEYSVKAATLGLRRLGVKVAVVDDAVLPLEIDNGKKANRAMREAGVEFITLETLLGVESGG